MCTLIALFGINPDVPLIVAANRDELYARRWAPPAQIAEHPRAFGGRDLEKGGTWLGVTERGFFVGVTNQRTYEPPDPSKQSRGALVLEALVSGSVSAALACLRKVDARLFNPFNLLLGDADGLHVAYARGDAAMKIEALPPGIWVLNNDTIGSRDFPKANRARDLVAAIAQEPWASLAPELMTVLGDHELPPANEVPEPPPGTFLTHERLRALQAICVHTETYGTSSATILALGRGEAKDYLFAAGPPCVTPFAPLTEPLGLGPPSAR